jgi:hypothetical protein
MWTCRHADAIETPSDEMRMTFIAMVIRIDLDGVSIHLFYNLRIYVSQDRRSITFPCVDDALRVIVFLQLKANRSDEIDDPKFLSQFRERNCDLSIEGHC